jgi:hypothetical protein
MDTLHQKFDFWMFKLHTVWIIHLKQEVPVKASANKGLTIKATIEEESRCARAYLQSAPTHKRNFVHNLLPVMEQDG